MTGAGGRYADRFEAGTYVDDPPVGVFVQQDDPEAVWVPERLFARLACVARGYSLHLLPLLGGHEPVTLNKQQVVNLLDELAFVAEVVPGDVLVTEQVSKLRRYLLRALTGVPELTVTVEGG